MKKLTGITATLLAALLCLGVLDGCSDSGSGSSSDTSSETSSESSSETSSEESSSQDEETDNGDVIGQVSYIGSATLVVDVYEPDSEIEDYTNVGSVAFTDKEVNSSITLEDDAVFQKVSGGELTDITLEDLEEGDMVAVTTDDEGGQTIIVLEVEMEDGSADGETSEETSDETADETSGTELADTEEETDSSAE
jgi:hypothetical protein